MRQPWPFFWQSDCCRFRLRCPRSDGLSIDDVCCGLQLLPRIKAPSFRRQRIGRANPVKSPASPHFPAEFVVRSAEPTPHTGSACSSFHYGMFSQAVCIGRRRSAAPSAFMHYAVIVRYHVCTAMCLARRSGVLLLPRWRQAWRIASGAGPMVSNPAMVLKESNRR